MASLLESSPVLRPRPHQAEAVAAITEHLRFGGRAQAIMACGTGKTLVGLWSKEELKARRTLVVAPTIALVDQNAREWRGNSEEQFRALAVCSDATVLRDDDERASDVAVRVTTSADDISEFLASDDEDLVVFSTYQSSPMVMQAMRRPGTAPFDLIVADEAHHCATDKESSFARVLDNAELPSVRRLFMTATKRTFSNSYEGLAASMDDEELFGREVYSLTFREAISRGLLADYQVLVVAVDGVEAAEMLLDETTWDAVTQVGLLKAISEHNLKRVLTFHSRVLHAASFAASLPEVSRQMGAASAGHLSTAHVSGLMNMRTREAIVERLAGDFDGTVVISNARCLGEGVDIPAVDGVCFGDPRESPIDIAQAMGRALRLPPGQQHKVATIVIPVEMETHEGVSVPREGAVRSLVAVVQALGAHDQDMADLMRTSFKPRQKRGAPSVTCPIGPIRFIAAPEVIADLERTVRLRVLREAAVGARWLAKYAQVVEYANAHGGMAAASRNRYYSWIKLQQRQYKAGRLSAFQVGALEAIPGWPWGPRKASWTSAADAELRRLVEAGREHVDIAEELGRTEAAVRSRASRLGVTHPGAREAWTVEADAELRRLAQSGRTHAEIAEESGRTLAAVHGRAAALGVARPGAPQAWTPALDAELRRLVEAGRPRAEIAEELGRTAGAVQYRVSALGVTGPASQAWTPALDAELRRLVEAGRPGADIAEELGRTLAAVYRRAWVLGVARPGAPQAWTPALDAELRRLVEAGRPGAEIAEELGRTTHGVSGRAHTLGITRRGAREPWTPEADTELRRLAQSGRTHAEIAEESGRTRSAVTGRVLRLRDSGRLVRETAEELERAASG